MRRLLCLLLAAVFLSSCDDIRFDEFEVRHPVNLEKIVGSNLTLIGPTDTLHLKVRFDVNTRYNTITALPDTASTDLMQAQVFRYRQLYYVVQKLKSGCWVHAMRIQGNQIQGLNEGASQMDDLGAVVQKGAFSELVRFHNITNDSIRLRFDAKKLRGFYTAELDSFPRYQIVRPAHRVQPAHVLASALAPAIRLYPNPARDQTTLDWGTAGNRTVQLYSAQGRKLHTYVTTAAQLTIPTAELAAGTYLLRLAGSRPDTPTTLRLVVRR